MNSIYKCPVCGHPIRRTEKVFGCDQKHSYDIAAQGYVNLLLANQKKTLNPGDSKEMVQARSVFLGRGYYDRLSDSLNQMILEFCMESADHDSGFNILDLGCGEGYYTQRLQNFLEKSNLKSNFQLWGIDVSKSAIQKAAKRNRNIQFCVGNNYRLPYLDESIDVAFSVFSPLEPKEFMRVLKPGGKIIVVRPGASHLKELASLLYEKAGLQGDSSSLSEMLNQQPVKDGHVKYKIHLKSENDIESLVGMTPYYWSLSEEKKALLGQMEDLKTMVDFHWSVFQK